MTSILQGALAATIGRAFANLFFPATLARDGVASGPNFDPTFGPTLSWPCKAIFDEWGSFTLAQGLVSGTDRKVLILATSLATVPQGGDRITLDGATLEVYSGGEGQPGVSTDPAKAVWTLRARA